MLSSSVFCFNPRVAPSAASLHSIPLYLFCSTVSLLFILSEYQLRRVALFYPGDVLKNHITFNLHLQHRPLNYTRHIAFRPVYGLNLPVSCPRPSVYRAHETRERAVVDPGWSRIGFLCGFGHSRKRAGPVRHLCIMRPGYLLMMHPDDVIFWLPKASST